MWGLGYQSTGGRDRGASSHVPDPAARWKHTSSARESERGVQTPLVEHTSEALRVQDEALPPSW